MYIGPSPMFVFFQEGILQSGGKVALTAEHLARFGRRLSPTDEVVLEATGNTAFFDRYAPMYRRS